MSEQIEEQIKQLFEAAAITDKEEVEKKVHQYATAAAGAMKMIGFVKGDKTSFKDHYDLAASHMYDQLSTHPDVHPDVQKFAKQKSTEHYVNRKAGEILKSMGKKNMNENTLIESTIRFAENTARINGNLRSGVIKEAQSFPDAHVVQGLSMYDKNKKDGALNSEAEGVVAHHAETKLGYPRDKAEDFAAHVSNVHSTREYISGPRSSLDRENLHGAIGGGSKFPEHHLKSGGEVLNHNIANGHPHPDDAVTLHGMALGYPHKKAIDFANAVSDEHARQKYISGPRSSLDRENLHSALGGSGKYAD